MKVLLADESGVVRGRLAGLLAHMPELEVHAAADGAEAVAACRRLRPELLILDLLLPGGGLRALHEAKRASPATRVIVLTNYVLPQNRRRCFAAGAEFFLDKSREFDEAVRIVGRLHGLEAQP